MIGWTAWTWLVLAIAACDRTGVPAGSDGATGDDGNTASDGPPPRPDGVPMFVAIGKIGRITTSCDGGKTWVANRSDDDTASCVGIDCDHHAGSSTGLTFGGGYIFASFGWGDHPARILRSTDGIAWTTVYDQRGFSFAGVVWAGDRLIGGDVTPRRSLDLGAMFTASAWPAYDNPSGIWPNARRVGYAPHGGGRIALFSSSGMWSDTTVSSDGGATFQHPTVLPAECRDRSSVGSVYGNGVWLQAWAPTGALCRSVDGGDTWSLARPVQNPDYDMSNVVFDGNEFVVYQGTRGYRSADGATWTGFDSNEAIGRIAVDPYTRTFVMVRGHWSGAPAEQQFFRSTDGVTWERLAPGDFVASHPITHIEFGFGAASSACP